MGALKSYNGPRSTFSLLPFDLRFKIISMIQDGKTCRAIGADPEAAKGYEAIGAEWNRSAMTRIKKSKEYKDIADRRIKEQLTAKSDRIASALLKENASLESVSEQVKVALLKLVQDCVATNPEEPEVVERLVRSVVNLSNPAKDNQITELKRQLREEKELRMAEIEGKEKIIAELRKLAAERDAQIEKLKERCGASGNNNVIEAMDEFVKGK